MKIMASVLALAALMPSMVAAQQTADTFNAGALNAACEHHSKGGTAQEAEFFEHTCVTYLRGLTDGLYLMQEHDRSHMPTCMPEEQPVSVPEARKALTAWLESHPQNADNSAGLVAGEAVVRSYPCRN